MKTWLRRTGRYASCGWLLIGSATGCHKQAEPKEQPRSAVVDAADVGESVPPPPAAPNFAPMLQENEPGRCVKQVIVGYQSIAFEFNRDYYWYLGDAGPRGFTSQREPFYHLIPKHYVELYLGRTLSCGRNADASIECWGFDSDGATNPTQPFGLGAVPVAPEAPAPHVDFASETPVVLTDVPSPVQLFALGDEDYCALAAGKVVCPAPRGHGSDEVRGLGDVKELMMGAGFGCARNEAQVWCWGQYSISKGRPATLDSSRAARAVSLPAGIGMRSLHLGSGHACLLGQDAAVYCFGFGNFGAWVTGAYGASNHSFPASEEQALTAHYVATLGHEVSEVGAGRDFSCALEHDGSVWCWGDNSHHIASDQEHYVITQWGTKMAIEPLPVRRSELGTDNRSLKVGQTFACVEKNDGALWCWGDNAALQLAAARSRFEPPHYVELPAPRCAGAN